MSKYSYAQGFHDGEVVMKGRVVKALEDAHRSDTGNDVCSGPSPCLQCEVWYEAIETAQKVDPE